jgi:hypothetical protein
MSIPGADNSGRTHQGFRGVSTEKPRLLNQDVWERLLKQAEKAKKEYYSKYYSSNENVEKRDLLELAKKWANAEKEFAISVPKHRSTAKNWVIAAKSVVDLTKKFPTATDELKRAESELRDATNNLPYGINMELSDFDNHESYFSFSKSVGDIMGSLENLNLDKFEEIDGPVDTEDYYYYPLVFISDNGGRVDKVFDVIFDENNKLIAADPENNELLEKIENLAGLEKPSGLPINKLFKLKKTVSYSDDSDSDDSDSDDYDSDGGKTRSQTKKKRRLVTKPRRRVIKPRRQTMKKRRQTIKKRRRNIKRHRKTKSRT